MNLQTYLGCFGNGVYVTVQQWFTMFALFVADNSFKNKLQLHFYVCTQLSCLNQVMVYRDDFKLND